MKIAIFSDTFPPQANGVANVAYLSAKGLAKLGHEVFVFTLSNKKRTNFEQEKIKVITLPSAPALVYDNERLTLPIGLSLQKLKKIKPDIIHTHTPFSVGWEAVWGAKFFKIPLVGTHHTFFDHYLKHVWLDYGWMKRVSWKYVVGYYNFCDLILSPSSSLARAFKNNALKKPIEVLENFIDTDLFIPAPTSEEKNQAKKTWGIESRSITYMGRLSYEKSIDQIVKAFALLLKKEPNLKLMLIGDGPEKANLEKLAKDLKIEKNVIFTGFVYKEELVKALWANEVFITASKSENMPLSVLEVMAAGLPVVSVKEKGLAEITKENVNGFFAKTDKPDDIAQKVLAILADSALGQKFSQASRALALEYSEEKIIRKLEGIYKKLIKK
jgi:1,2-diacylglycerol 3-alpha-glucosyltransferase